ncbi:MAG: NRDE family protein [Planctomycetes bacterium]|nr:NRDE family protein [Planctomycetota bacterium]
MCILAIQYQLVPDSPILIAANREEFYDRPSQPPSIQSGKPRILCGIDQQAGGTWLGVNQNGMFVACCNRMKLIPPLAPRSRGVLCRDLLRCGSARHAMDQAMDELSTGKSEGVNYIVADAESAWAVHGGDELNVVELEEGLSIIANNDVNDPRDERVQLAYRLLTLQTLDSPVKFLAVAR